MADKLLKSINDKIHAIMQRKNVLEIVEPLSYKKGAALSVSDGGHDSGPFALTPVKDESPWIPLPIGTSIPANHEVIIRSNIDIETLHKMDKDPLLLNYELFKNIQAMVNVLAENKDIRYSSAYLVRSGEGLNYVRECITGYEMRLFQLPNYRYLDINGKIAKSNMD